MTIVCRSEVCLKYFESLILCCLRSSVDSSLMELFVFEESGSYCCNAEEHKEGILAIVAMFGIVLLWM